METTGSWNNRDPMGAITRMSSKAGVISRGAWAAEIFGNDEWNMSSIHLKECITGGWRQLPPTSQNHLPSLWLSGIHNLHGWGSGQQNGKQPKLAEVLARREENLEWIVEDMVCVDGAVNTSCHMKTCDLPCRILEELLPEFIQSKWTWMGQRVTIVDAASPGTGRLAVGISHLSPSSGIAWAEKSHFLKAHLFPKGSGIQWLVMGV